MNQSALASLSHITFNHSFIGSEPATTIWVHICTINFS